MNILLRAYHIDYMDVKCLRPEDQHSESGYQHPGLMDDLPFEIDKADMPVYFYRLGELLAIHEHDSTVQHQAINSRNHLEYKTGTLAEGRHISSEV